MSKRRIGAAVVIDAEHAGIGILTERDLLDSIAAGEDPDAELVAQHRTEQLVYASPDWTLEDAAAAMVRGGFRHLVVIEGNDVAGLLSMRDIVRCWVPRASRHPASHDPASHDNGLTRRAKGHRGIKIIPDQRYFRPPVKAFAYFRYRLWCRSGRTGTCRTLRA